MSIVLSCRYERDDVLKRIMVSICNIAALYFLVLLQPGECSPGGFCDIQMMC